MGVSDNEKSETSAADPANEGWSLTTDRCREMLERIPVVAYLCDARGRITFFNQPAETVWGRTPQLRDDSERYCGSHQLYAGSGEAIRHEGCWMALALMHAKPYHGRDIIIERADGSRTLGEAYAHPLLDDEERVVGGVNLVADVTELKGAKNGNAAAANKSIPYSASVAIINIVVPVLSAMRWQRAAFD